MDREDKMEKLVSDMACILDEQIADYNHMYDYVQFGSQRNLRDRLLSKALNWLEGPPIPIPDWIWDKWLTKLYHDVDMIWHETVFRPLRNEFIRNVCIELEDIHENQYYA